MFLLILVVVSNCVFEIIYLHSTMFLLIREYLKERGTIRDLFTFHNVSINSYRLHNRQEEHRNLHSTMFLLIPNSSCKTDNAIKIIYIPQCFY